MSMVVDKVGNCQEKLKWWSRRCFGNINWEIAEKKRKMKEAEVSGLHGNNVEIFVQLKNELAGLLVKEEQMWHQQSKTHWIRGIKTQSISTIKPLKGSEEIGFWAYRTQGVSCMGDDSVAGLLENYYQQLFTSSNPCDLEEVT